MTKATHSQKLERWLSIEEIEQISISMKDWYGPPIAMGNVPGKVYAHKGGDFRGHIEAGSEASLLERAYDVAKRMEASANRQLRRWLDRQQEGLQLNTGFASLSDLISESRSKSRNFPFFKGGFAANSAGSTNSLWRGGNVPAAGAVAAAAPGGTVPTNASTGAFFFSNPDSPDTQWVTSGWAISTVAMHSLLLYDRLFSVNKTMSSSTTEAVTGVPTRYQNNDGFSQSTDLDCRGNFLFIESELALSATAHSWTVCKYTAQDGTGGTTLPSFTGVASSVAGGLDHPANSWFCPLAAKDSGILKLEQMQCSVNTLTGNIDFTIGHPIAWFPCPIANSVISMDGIQGAFQLERILDGACLAFLEVIKPATTLADHTGSFTTVSG